MFETQNLFGTNFIAKMPSLSFKYQLRDKYPNLNALSLKLRDVEAVNFSAASTASASASIL